MPSEPQSFKSQFLKECNLFAAAWGKKHTTKIELSNLMPQDCQFFDGLVKLFADPDNHKALEAFRSGESALLWESDSTGPMLVHVKPQFGNN